LVTRAKVGKIGVVILVCGLFCETFISTALANEISLPSLPSLPSPTPVPSLPTMPTFETPKPPDALQTSTAMPDMAFWKDSPKKNSPGPNVVQNADKNKNTEKNSGPILLAWPVWGKVSSEFGPRGTGRRRRMHEGIDIPVPKGTPIQAAAAGVVLEAQVYNGYGQTVIVDHGNGMRTLYAHCSEVTVRKGDKVQQGQAIAYAGNTGRSTAHHLHFGVMVSGSFRDPMMFLQKGPQELVKRPEGKKRR
jgi:murein DD-endopeptidase MepM/ murein hydrolase activator NlpD